MRLLERDHPLDVLLERARRAAEGHGSLVLVAGEAGIGKTVLLRRFADRASRTGGPPLYELSGPPLGNLSGPPLWGLCDPLSTPRPLGPLRDVAAALSPGLPEMLRSGAPPYEIFAAVLDALRTGPRVVIIEDLHWADQATLDLVRFLARRLATLPLLLVVTYRDAVGADHPLRPVLGDLVSTPDARRLQLAPLSRSAVAELLSGRDLDVEVVHRRTAGNPFFVSQIAAQPDSPLPHSVRDAVLARTAVLPGPARGWLELLSCAPESVNAELLGTLAVPTDVIGTLTATGLLDRHGDGVAFRHEIARTAVLGAIEPGVEVTLHARMIEALERLGGEASVLLHHADAAGDVARILRYAPRAAVDAATSGAHREALACYESALRHVGEDHSARAALLEGRSGELYVSDRLGEAIEARTAALELHRELGDGVAVGAGHRALSLLAWYAADRASAEHHDRAAVAILDGAGDPLEYGYALANRAYLAAQRGAAEEALLHGGRAADIAEQLDDDPLRATAAIPLAVTRLLQGDLGARAELLAARDTGLRAGVDELATAPMSNLGHLDVEQGRFAEADSVLADALKVSEERGIAICWAWQCGVQARLRLLQGRWEDAERDARAVLGSGNLPLGRLWPHLVLGLLAARRDAPPANPDLDELWRLALRLDQPGKVVPAAAALAEQAWITGRPDERLGLPAVSELANTAFTGRDRTLVPLRTWARRLVAADVQHLGALATPVDVGRPGATGADPVTGMYDRAMSAWDAGTVDGLITAVADLDGLGARAVAARFRARLRELGASGIPRGRSAGTRANPAGLTARQLDVLSLLVDGLSNADIAARLVISQKTADHHVSAILAKLEVRSRGEAAAMARRLGV